MEMQARWENQLLALAGHVPHPSTRPFFSYWAGDAALQKAYKHAEISPLSTANPFTSRRGSCPRRSVPPYVPYTPFAGL